MSVTRCKRGHLYDPAKHDRCPYCGVEDLDSPGRVFISSTSTDLEGYRQAVFYAIMALGGSAEDMIYWSADDREPAELSVDRVLQSDVLVLLIAHRYGTVPEGSAFSITEQEYNTARSGGVPVLAFCVDENLPWPPQYIEWEKRDQLSAFKKKVRSEVTVKTFTTPDQLTALVSQAFATFKRRQRTIPAGAVFRRRGTLRVDPSINLASSPDLTIQIGLAEDELPLLLGIRRSRDLTAIFQELTTMTSRPGFESPQALLATFRQSVERHAVGAWASDGIESVSMQDGSVQDLFIPRTPLSCLFRSTFGALLVAQPLTSSSRPIRKIGARSARESTVATAHLSPAREPHRALESEGGSNRFLGVATNDGRTFSVGRPRDESGRTLEGWREWRPFFFESLPHYFSEATFFVWDGSRTSSGRVPLIHYQESLMEVTLSIPDSEALLDFSVLVDIPKSAIASLIVRLAHAVAELHASGVRVR